MVRPVAIFSEWKPCPALGPYVHSFIAVKFADPEIHRPPNPRNGDGAIECQMSLSHPLMHRMVPGGHMLLGFNVGDPVVYSKPSGALPDAGRSNVLGAVTQPIDVEYGRHVESFGALFHPGQAHVFLRPPAEEMTDRILPLDNFWGPEARSFEARLLEIPSMTQRIRALEKELLRRLNASRMPQIRVSSIAELIVRSSGGVTVEALSESAGVSRQHLSRQFRQYLGMTPKQFCRITRFQALLDRANTSQRVDWSEAAADLGYYDQAHLIAEFKEFTGLSPTQFSAAL